MPYYAAYPSAGSLANRLAKLLEEKDLSSFQLSRKAGISPTTARKISIDKYYIPSPDVLERICIALDIQPGDLLEISSKMSTQVAVGSGV